MARNKDIICPYCGKTFKNNFIRKHLINDHKLTDVEWIVLSEQYSTSRRKRFKDVPVDIMTKYLKRVYDKLGKLERYQIWATQFSTFHRIVTHCRAFIDSDFDQFFNVVLPWQLKHQKICNSKELCSLCHSTNDEYAAKAYHELMEVKNPYYHHGGKFSPFSKNFVGYDGLSDGEKRDAAFKRARENNDNIIHTTSIQYWLNKGYSEEDAKKKLSERQRTFTLEKCVAKYGDEEGRRIYEDRQKRWLNTLNDRYGDKWDELSSKKSPSSPTYFSYESQALFWEIEANRTNKEHKSRFALNGDSRNNELEFERDNGRHYFFDYCIPDIKCVIEYDGSRWHNEETKEYDENRIMEIESKGYRVLNISDVEYKTDRVSTVKKCLDFIHMCEVNV